MGTHPNVILKMHITAEGTTRKLLRELLAENRSEVPDDDLPFLINGKGEKIENRLLGGYARQSRDETQLSIGSFVYDTLVMESDYDESIQIRGKEGELIIFDLVTYGYGEEIRWNDLNNRVVELEGWAQSRKQLGYRMYQIAVSANYCETETHMNDHPVCAVGDIDLEDLGFDKAGNLTTLTLNEEGRLTLKKLLYSSITPDGYRAMGFTREQIKFLDYLGDRI